MYREEHLDYVYQIQESVVDTYYITVRENQICAVKNGRYHMDILGDRTIEKLIGKGFLSMEEACLKYGISNFPIYQIETQCFLKKLCKKKKN